jgi:hypothetical protein
MDSQDSEGEVTERQIEIELGAVQSSSERQFVVKDVELESLLTEVHGDRIVAIDALRRVR